MSHLKEKRLFLTKRIINKHDMSLKVGETMSCLGIPELEDRLLISQASIAAFHASQKPQRPPIQSHPKEQGKPSSGQSLPETDEENVSWQQIMFLTLASLPHLYNHGKTSSLPLTRKQTRVSIPSLQGKVRGIMWKTKFHPLWRVLQFPAGGAELLGPGH